MFETIGTGLFGGLLGGLFRLAPEVLKLLDRKNERSHELKMFTLQTDLEKLRGQFRMEEKYVDHSKASLDAISDAFKQQSEADKRSGWFIASLSASVRPGIAWVMFAMYCAVKVTTMVYGINSGMSLMSLTSVIWTTDDVGILMMILTFFYVGRSIERYNSR